MRLGLGPIRLERLSASDLRALAVAATASSFDCIWVAEARAEGVGGGLAAAALLAQLTPIRVGAVVDLGGYHPLHVAEDIAVCDLTTGGRLEVIVRLPGDASLRAALEEHLRILAAALSGAHLQWHGEHLKVPARMEANQPSPDRLALNPSPAQPAVPIWVQPRDAEIEALAAKLGFGIAAMWPASGGVPEATGRLPGVVFCPSDVSAEALLAAAGNGPAYFIVDASDGAAAAAAGRRLAGPLRMPAFPEWVNAD